MVKRENERDHRLISYIIALPLGVDVTNSEVLKEHAYVLDKINTDIKESVLQHLWLNIEDIVNEGIGIRAMSNKLQSILQRFNDDKLKVTADLASVILSQGAVSSCVVSDIIYTLENDTHFEEFFRRCNEMCMKRVEGALAKRHGSREVVTHVTSIRELHRLISKEVQECYPDVQEAHNMTPSYDYLLKQFTPKNNYAMKADRYFSRLHFQLSLTGRSNHVKHTDFDYTQAVKSYMKQYAVEYRDISIFIQVDDKNKVIYIIFVLMYERMYACTIVLSIYDSNNFYDTEPT